MEETALLVAMQRIVGRIQIENDLLRWRLVCLEEEVDEQALDRARIMPDLVVAVVGPQRRVLQSVERALARERGAVLALGPELAGQRRQHRVVAQVIVVDQVLVTERDAEHPLRHHRRDRVLDLRLGTVVDEARGEPPDHANRPIGRAEQQPAGVRGVVTTVKRGDHLAPLDHFITEQVAATLCPHRGIPPERLNSLSQKNYRRSRAPMHLPP